MFNTWIIFFRITEKCLPIAVRNVNNMNYSTFTTYNSSLFKNMFNFISQTCV
jgi:hypothetical protein